MSSSDATNLTGEGPGDLATSAETQAIHLLEKVANHVGVTPDRGGRLEERADRLTIQLRDELGVGSCDGPGMSYPLSRLPI